jgi:hypothetical protein
MGDEIPPEFGGTVFSCPHCHIAANQIWFNATRKFLTATVGSTVSISSTKIIEKLAVSQCVQCHKDTIWYDKKILYPVTPLAPPPNRDMPDDVKADYLEAREIAEKSPSAAVAILRRALQKLLPYIGGEGKNINNDINKLAEEGLDVSIIKSLDIIRVIGNESVHPGVIDVDDHDMAMFAFTLLNLIVENRISHRQRIDEIHKQLPPNKILSFFKRDKN